MTYLRQWLPHILWLWLERRRFHVMTTHGESCAYWIVIPDGYQFSVKKENLEQENLIGVMLTPQGLKKAKG